MRDRGRYEKAGEVALEPCREKIFLFRPLEGQVILETISKSKNLALKRAEVGAEMKLGYALSGVTLSGVTLSGVVLSGVASCSALAPWLVPP